MQDTVKVRFATLADTDYVSQDGLVSTAIVKRKIEAEEVVIAERNGKPAGYLRLEYLWSIIPYIGLIYVEPAHRRQGIGKSLLEFTVVFLKARGYKHLYSSSQTNEPEPQSWHRHMGFEECGIIAGINQDGVGEIFFRMRLLQSHSKGI